MAGTTPKVITARHCDEPMARAMGIIGPRRTNLPRCKKACKDCFACIEVDSEGNREHVGTRRERR